ncbi:MAG: WYL domain-containing protein, partial [Erysipelotrichaceae bacterium]|nr:WYL domain-containing protein [Erysipelotrichaceae bacterium]
MAEKKQSLLALIEIMKKYSDERHPLTIKEIQNYLLNEYDINLDRRTLYASMELLRDFNYEVSEYDGKGYYLIERQFEKGEILLLCNAVHASHFISAKQSDDLIKKLLNTQSKYQQSEFRDKVYMANPLKTPNRQLLLNIEEVSDAIRDSRQLSFRYMRYDSSKQLVERRPEPYIVEPRYIVYADSRPYLIVTSQNHEGFIHYRLDRMKDVRVLKEKSRILPKQSDPYEYARNKLFMYTGETYMVTYRCKESVMDHMIDIFGTDLLVIPDKEDTFIIKVRTSEQGALYLAQQFMENITIVEPE